jgi:hypothetical protein
VGEECKKIEAPGWNDGMTKHHKDFVAGPPTQPTGVGDEACMITGDRVAQVWIYARRHRVRTAPLRLGQRRHHGDVGESRRPHKAIFNAQLSWYSKQAGYHNPAPRRTDHAHHGEIRRPRSGSEPTAPCPAISGLDVRRDAIRSRTGT